MRENMFEQLDFGAFKEYIENDDITDISYTNNGQIWVRSLEKGSYRVENPNINNAVVEKLAFQCSNVMGTTFNNASPFLDAESPELRMNFVHESIATNGIALVIRKTPAKIRLKEENLLKEDYVTKDIHDFLIKCVLGHCNIMVCGETGSGKTEFVKYLASHTKENEKIITIEDTLELHLDRIYPNRDIVAMKTNNIASYSEVLVTCMRQNPKWILLSEVRSAEAVTAVRNSISSGHNILSTIHSDKASAIPHRLYSLMETDLDLEQFLNTIYRYIQLGVHIKAYFSPSRGKFHREIDEITEFYIDEETNEPVYNVIYHKTMTGKVVKKQPSKHLMDFLLGQNIDINNVFTEGEEDGSNSDEAFDLDTMSMVNTNGNIEKVENSNPLNNDLDLNQQPLLSSNINASNESVNISEQQAITNEEVNNRVSADTVTPNIGVSNINTINEPVINPLPQPVVNNEQVNIPVGADIITPNSDVSSVNLINEPIINPLPQPTVNSKPINNTTDIGSANQTISIDPITVSNNTSNESTNINHTNPVNTETKPVFVLPDFMTNPTN